jgi:hypothetical protein
MELLICLRNLARDVLERCRHGRCRGVAEESTLNDGARLDYRRRVHRGQELINVAARLESDKDVVMKKFLPRIFAHLALACTLLMAFA